MAGGDEDGEARDGVGEVTMMSVESLPRYREALARMKAEASDAEAGELERVMSESGEALLNFPANFPSVKQIPGTRFVVDGFRSAGRHSVAYFLSHFHSDHYTGITPLWNRGIIFCSEITASLVLHVLKVAPALVVALPMGHKVSVDGVEVSLVDANHCPGAVQFLFRVPEVNSQPDGSCHHRYVHCGDMRYAPFMKEDASLAEYVGADAVFLDTTYCNPKFIFPSQLESVGYVADTVVNLMQLGESLKADVDDMVEGSLPGNGSSSVDGEEPECRDDDDDEPQGDVKDSSSKGFVGEDDEDVFRVARQGGTGSGRNGSVLFLISTYVIGKEKILTAVARKCNCLIYVNEWKLSILKCLKLEDEGVFTTDPAATNVHVVGWSFLGETWPYFRPNFGNMEKILAESGFSRVVGFVPTGWAYELRKKTFSVRRKGSCEIHLVPYSEHSNYDELREYVGYLRPKEIIPTVGLDGDGVDGKAVAAMRKHFRNLVDETASKRKFLKCFTRRVAVESDVSLRKQADAGANLAGVHADSAAAGNDNADNIKVNVSIPKAAFGRGARKRRREIDAPPADAGEEQQDMAALIASQISLEVKTKSFGEEGASSAVTRNGSGAKMLITSPRSEEMDFTQRAGGSNHLSLSVGAGQEVEESLRSILPSWVTEEQVERLMRKANGDVNVAVANFYEQEMDLMDEVQGWAGGVASIVCVEAEGSPAVVESTKGDELGELRSVQNPLKQGNSEGRGLLRSSAFVETAATKASTLGKRLASKTASKVSTSKGKNRTMQSTGKAAKTTTVPNGKTGKNKAKASVSVTSLDKKRASQPTILNFFKKAGTEVVIDKVKNDTDATEAVDDPLHFIDSGSQVGLDMDIEDDNVVNTFTTTAAADLEGISVAQLVPKEVVKTDRLNENDVGGPFQYNDEVSQLLSILDGNINKKEAEVLLQKVHGNVSEALDLHYEIKSEHDQGKSSACNTISIGCVIEATANQYEAEEASVAKGSDFSFVNTDLVREDMEVSKPGSSGGSSDRLESLAVKLEEPPSASNISVGLKTSVGSVAMPIGQYNPIAHACWKGGEPAPYVHLARAFDLVEHESGRLKTADMLCNMFRSLLALSPEDVLPAVYLATNRIAPDHESTDLNIGGSIVAAAISEATGTPRAKLRDMYNSMGDLGDVAQACRQNQSMLRPPPALRIRQVFATLHQISKESGNGSGGRKKGLVLGLVRACREKETKYIVRTLVQNMRIGAMMRTVLHALAQAVVLHKCLPSDSPTEKSHESLKSNLQEASAAAVEAYNFLPNLDLLIPKLINEGVEGLAASISVLAGTPIKPMLAKITNGIPEVLKKFQGKAFTSEYKYDGQRAQIHLLPDRSVRIFSRNGEDNTSKFPDVADIVRSAMQPETEMFIIDAEVVAVDRLNGNNLLAFQHLSTRERGTKDGSIVQNIKVEVCVFLFDIMLANSESLVKCPLRERRKYMHTIFPNLRPGYFQYASEITLESDEAQPESTSTSQKLDSFLDEAFGASCEGLMAKALDEDSTYMASKRSDSWLKVKRDYVEGLHDTLDLVPIGAWHGNGRKAGWFSPYLVACYDSNNEEYQSVCRVMSGFSDAFYRESKEFYSEGRILPKKPVYYQTREECDVWFSAEVVWEIRGADLTISPVHQAGVGLVHPSRGISMRFPRFISARTDKKPEDASSPSDIADLFHQQTRKLNVSGMGGAQKDDSE